MNMFEIFGLGYLIGTIITIFIAEYKINKFRKDINTLTRNPNNNNKSIEYINLTDDTNNTSKENEK